MSHEMERAKLRIADADREQAVNHLQTCTADGRLTLTEYSDRVDAVYAAKTFGDLEPVMADLPVQGSPTSAIAPTAEFSPVASSVKRKGVWLVPGRIVLKPKASSVVLDMSKAAIGHREIDIDINAHASSVNIILPRDAWATDNVQVKGATVSNRAHSTGAQTGVCVRVQGSVAMSSVKIRRKRRFLWW